MSENNFHPGVEHIWACRTFSGQIGEIEESVLLTDEAVLKVLADKSRAQEFCPGGQIICNSCEQPLIEGQEAQVSSINLVDIREHLVKPSSSSAE